MLCLLGKQLKQRYNAHSYCTTQLWFKRPPFKGKNTNEIIRLVMIGERPAVLGQPDQGPAPPRALGKLIEACWANKTIDRPKIMTVFSTFESQIEPAVAAFKGVIGPTDRFGEASLSPTISADLHHDSFPIVCLSGPFSTDCYSRIPQPPTVK